MRLRELFKDRGLSISQRRRIRLALAVLFCLGVIMCNRPAHAIVSVNSGSSGWGASTASAAGGVLFDVAKKLVAPGSPYAPVEILKKGSQSAVSLAGSVLSRCRAVPQVCVLLAGAAAAAAWYVATREDGVSYLAKPPAGGSAPVPPNNGYYTVLGVNYSSEYAACKATGWYSNGIYYSARPAGEPNGYCFYNRSAEYAPPEGMAGGISYTPTSTFCDTGYYLSGGQCLPAAQAVSDSEIKSVYTDQLAFDPEKALAFVKAQGLWNPEVQVLTEIPVSRATPATLVKVEPQADGTVKKITTTQTPVTTTTCDGSSCSVTTHMETVNNVTITNSSGQVINQYSDSATTPDGHYNVDATQASNVDIPTDYGREATQQAIRDQLKFSRPGTVLEAPTFAGTLSTFWTGLGALPLLAPFKSFFSALFSIAGSCPEYSIPFFGHSLPMTAHCTLGQLAAGIFYLVTALIYSVPAVRVFLSA